jgi:hypothetical protein
MDSWQSMQLAWTFHHTLATLSWNVSGAERKATFRRGQTLSRRTRALSTKLKKGSKIAEEFSSVTLEGDNDNDDGGDDGQRTWLENKRCGSMSVI